MKLVKTWWLPDQEQHLDEWIQREGEYQAPHRANALSHVKKWDVAIDIGAHVGLWSREFSEKFGRVHSFEPVAEHRACFVKNVTKENVTLYPYALGETEGFVTMRTDPHSTGGTHVDPELQTGEIARKTLDSFNLDPDFIKLDCEAYEIYVLKGARETLLRCKPIVCIEQKNQRYYGNDRYIASHYLESLGASLLSRFKDDCVFGWS